VTAERRNLAVSVATFAIFVALLVWSDHIPDARGREFPVLVSGAAVILAALDVLAHSGTAAGRWVTLVLAGAAPPAPSERRRLPAEAMAVVWVAAALALVIVAGFLVAIPVYVFLYLLLHGRRTLRHSVIAAVATTFGIWLGFEVLLRYELYGGLLFPG
jgi:Tripartite tricarboxylate transporter TctB family